VLKTREHIGMIYRQINLVFHLQQDRISVAKLILLNPFQSLSQMIKFVDGVLPFAFPLFVRRSRFFLRLTIKKQGRVQCQLRDRGIYFCKRTAGMEGIILSV
jgi:hypothetical protein